MKQIEADIKFLQTNRMGFDTNQRLDEIQSQNYSTFSSPFVPELQRTISNSIQRNVNISLGTSTTIYAPNDLTRNLTQPLLRRIDTVDRNI